MLNVLLIAHRTVREPTPKATIHANVSLLFDHIDQKAFDWVLKERFNNGLSELRMLLGMLEQPKRHQDHFDRVVNDRELAVLQCVETFGQVPALTRNAKGKRGWGDKDVFVTENESFGLARKTWGDPNHYAVSLIILPAE